MSMPRILTQQQFRRQYKAQLPEVIIPANRQVNGKVVYEYAPLRLGQQSDISQRKIVTLNNVKDPSKPLKINNLRLSRQKLKYLHPIIPVQPIKKQQSFKPQPISSVPFKSEIVKQTDLINLRSSNSQYPYVLRQKKCCAQQREVNPMDPAILRQLNRGEELKYNTHQQMHSISSLRSQESDLQKLVSWQKVQCEWNFDQSINWNMLNKREQVKSNKNQLLRSLI